MFEQLVKRSNWVGIYKMGRFASERRAFLCHLSEQGHSVSMLRNINKLLLAVAERVNVRKAGEITEAQTLRAAKSWATKSCAPSSKAETREMARKRCFYWAKNWFRFLGKWRDPVRNAAFRPELDSFLNWLRNDRGYTDQTISTRESALHVFLEWLGTQSMSLKEVSHGTLAAYFVQSKAQGRKKSTVKAYAQSLRAFFRYAGEHGWCAPGLADTIQSPTIYSLAGLPQGPSWEQVQRLIAKSIAGNWGRSPA